MTAEQAAKRLDERLRHHSWYVSVGVGTTPKGEGIFVYVKSARHHELRSIAHGWMGYPILVRSVGSITAADRERISRRLAVADL
jgi:hypothetical protein